MSDNIQTIAGAIRSKAHSDQHDAGRDERMRVVQARWAFIEDLVREVGWIAFETGKPLVFFSPRVE